MQISTTEKPLIGTYCNCCRKPAFQSSYCDEFKGLPLVFCRNCGHLQVSIVPSPEELSDYYSTSYSLSRGKYVDKAYERVMEMRAEAQYQFIDAHLKESPANICDYGAGYGYLVARFLKSDIVAFGYESDGECIRVAKEKSLDIKPSPKTLGAAELPHVNLLCMSHVLEHLPDPEEFLQQLQGIVPCVFIEIPVYSSHLVKQFVDQEGHLNFFTEKSFCSFISNIAGVELTAIERCGPSLERYWHPSLRNIIVNRISRRLSGDWFFDQYGTNGDGMWLRALVNLDV
ncbi:MAG: hypothetical protein CMQ38_01305 [Gammaproteobacteria bacterium]|nr:hypothetical protein [Gammaproteobacteria bacterium]